MQWTTNGNSITLPYVAPEDDLQSTPATIKALAEAVVAELENLSGPPTGSLTAYMKGPDGVPEGWLECNGDPFDMDANPKLALILTNGLTPDLRDRAPMAAGTSITEAAPGGTSSVTLGAANLPSHRHEVFFRDAQHRHRFWHSRVVGGLAGGGTYIEISVNEHGPADTPHDSQIDLSFTGASVGDAISGGTPNVTGYAGSATPTAIDITPAHYGVSCYIIKGG